MRTGAANSARPFRRLLPLAETAALALLIALFVFKGLVPAWGSLRSDFANYYVVARLLREHYAMDRIYDWIWLQRIKDHWSIQQPLLGFAGLTPFSALPMVPLSWLGALTAKRVWLIVNLVILAALPIGLNRLTGIGVRRAALIAFLAIIPLRNSFLLGQMHLVLLGLLVIAYLLYARRQWLGCGLVLAVAASLKVYPLLFVLYFLRKREWKPALVLAGSTLAIFAASIPIFGIPVMRVFLVEQFPHMLRGEVLDPFSLTSPSASSLFHRAFLAQPQVNPHPPISSPLLYALLYPLWQLSLLGVTLLSVSPRVVDARRRCLEWAAWICLLLTLSTEPASYHRVVLVFVAILAVSAAGGAWRRAILLGCYFLACNVHPAISFQHPGMALLFDFLPFYALVAILAWLTFTLRPFSFGSSAAWFAWPRSRTAWALAGFAAVWAVASATTFAHVRSLDNSAYLLNRTNGVYAQFAPHAAGKHLLTVAMLPQGYRVEDENGGRFQTARFGADEDQLAIASSNSVNGIWIEAVSEGRSRLVELPANSSDEATAPIAIIPDAESPALAPDGSSLVFLREAKGAGSAWLVRLDSTGHVLTAPEPASLVGMDVRDAAFAAPDSILLTAEEHGVAHLFVTLAGGAPQRVLSDADAMRSPLAQTAGGVLVRQQLRNGYWRLMESGSLLNNSVQLTFGDCNAFDPAWRDRTTLIYMSDCGRGLGLGALASVNVLRLRPAKPETTAPLALSMSYPQGEPQQ